MKLVGNLTQDIDSFGILILEDSAQAFTTGTNEDGYTLSSIEIDYYVAPSRGTTSVGLWSVSDGLPHLKIADLTNPSSISKGVNVFTAPSETKLRKDTTYAVFVKAR